MSWMYSTAELPSLCAAFYVGEFATSRKAASNLMLFEFNQLTDNLYKFFIEYGIYAVGRELRHASRHTHNWDLCMYNHKSTKYDSYETRRWGQCECEDCGHVCIQDSDIYYEYEQLQGYNPDDVERFKKVLERRYKAYSKPHKFLKNAAVVFSEYSWDSSYGGNMWMQIAETLNKFDTLNRNTFIDCCWHLQHNTATWFNKMDYGAGRDFIRLANVLDVKFKGLNKFTINMSKRFYGSELNKIRYIF